LKTGQTKPCFFKANSSQVLQQLSREQKKNLKNSEKALDGSD